MPGKIRRVDDLTGGSVNNTVQASESPKPQDVDFIGELSYCVCCRWVVDQRSMVEPMTLRVPTNSWQLPKILYLMHMWWCSTHIPGSRRFSNYWQLHSGLRAAFTPSCGLFIRLGLLEFRFWIWCGLIFLMTSLCFVDMCRLWMRDSRWDCYSSCVVGGLQRMGTRSVNFLKGSLPLELRFSCRLLFLVRYNFVYHLFFSW